MPARRTVTKKSSKSASKATAKKSKKKISGKKSTTGRSGKKSSGILDKAKKAIKAVFAGAATGAAEGAVAGAAEAGSKVTGIGADNGKGPSKQSKKKAAKN